MTVPLGKPLPLTDEQLEELSQISPTDVENAKVFWRKHASDEFKNLLDAEPLDEEKS